MIGKGLGHALVWCRAGVSQDRRIKSLLVDDLPERRSFCFFVFQSLVVVLFFFTLELPHHITSHPITEFIRSIVALFLSKKPLRDLFTDSPSIHLELSIFPPPLHPYPPCVSPN